MCDVIVVCLHCHVMCPISLNSETGCQIVRIYILWIIRCGALQQFGMVTNFSYCPAETRANQLLGSADPGHVESSNRSAAKKLIMVIKANGNGAHVEFHLN